MATAACCASAEAVLKSDVVWCLPEWGLRYHRALLKSQLSSTRQQSITPLHKH